jgi:MATE family multidrug resistance protein
MFQCAERFLQVQGEFKAITLSAFIVLAVHVALLPFLADQLGFIGVPIAVVAARTLQPVLLVLYVRFVKGLDCWEGFTRRALRNWGMMLELAVPDMIMTEAEFLAFEIMTIFASRFGTEYLAAQSVLTTVTMVCFNVPFSMSITVSLRVSQLIGAGYVKAAKMTANLVCGILLFRESCLLTGIPRASSLLSLSDLSSSSSASLPATSSPASFRKTPRCDGLLRRHYPFSASWPMASSVALADRGLVVPST